MARAPSLSWLATDGAFGPYTSLSIPIPANAQDGDFVFGTFRVAENPGTITYPSYITNLVADATFTVGSIDSRMRLFWFRRNAAAQGSNFTISWTTSQHAQILLMGFRGVDTTTPFGTLPQNNQTTGAVNGGSSFPFNSVNVSAGQLAILIGAVQCDGVDEGIISFIASGPYLSPDWTEFPSLLNDPDYNVEARCHGHYRQPGESSLAGGVWPTNSAFGTAASTYYSWHFTLNPRSPVITDIDGDEAWNDGDTGLVITGTGLGI